MYTLCAERYAPSAESQAESKAQRLETEDRRPEIENCYKQSSFQKSFFPSSVIRPGIYVLSAERYAVCV